MGHIKKRKKVSWTKRLYSVVKRIDTHYILFTLSDYFLIDKVDQARLNNCLEFIRSNSKIACISLYPNESCDKESSKSQLEGFYKCVKGSPFVVNAQMGIWNKEALLDLLHCRQNAWEWEENASEYSFYLDYDYYTAADEQNLIFPYDWRADGYAVCARKWTRKCEELFLKHDIDVDLSIRGIWNPEEPHSSFKRYSKVRYLFRPPFIKRCIKNLKRVVGK